MSWICPMCSTSNEETDEKCIVIVCDAMIPVSAKMGFDVQSQMQKLSSAMTSIINSLKVTVLDAEQEYSSGRYHYSRKE